jgi:hypothetical protein
VVVAKAGRDGVVLEVRNLVGVTQVEGILDWSPSEVRYVQFDMAAWWVASPQPDMDWLFEFSIEPSVGQASWGIWRSERLSGDGVLGIIRFRGATPTPRWVAAWVDGQPVEGLVEDRRVDLRAPDIGRIVRSYPAPDALVVHAGRAAVIRRP